MFGVPIDCLYSKQEKQIATGWKINTNTDSDL